MPDDKKARKEEERKEGGREGGSEKGTAGSLSFKKRACKQSQGNRFQVAHGFGLVTSAPPACYSAARKKIPGEQGLCSTDLLVSAASNTGSHA